MISKMREKAKNKKGFTLVELIVVLVILGILIALLVPALTGYIDKANKKKVQTEARMLLMGVQAMAADEYQAINDGNTGTVVLVGKTDVTNLNGKPLGNDDQTIAEFSEVKGKYSTVKISCDESGAVTALEYVSKDKKYTATYNGSAWTVKKN